MSTSAARAALQRLIEERGEDYAGLSRLLGRNPAYIQQYITRGTPKRLSPKDVAILARYFGVGEDVLSGVSVSGGSEASPDLFEIPRFSVRASAGSGALAGT